MGQGQGSSGRRSWQSTAHVLYYLYVSLVLTPLRLGPASSLGLIGVRSSLLIFRAES